MDIGNGLLVAYLVDEGDSFAYIQHRHLDRDGVTEEELYDIGIDNLLELAAENELRVVQHGNFYAAILDGHFEASLLLVDSLWRDSFRPFVTGDYLVAIPNRDILAFCDRSSPAGRAELLDVIERLKGSGDHPLSRELFVRRDSEWIIDAMA
jgi:uncharacterized protein YtpQ (UPF0354 family)